MSAEESQQRRFQEYAQGKNSGDSDPGFQDLRPPDSGGRIVNVSQIKHIAQKKGKAAEQAEIGILPRRLKIVRIYVGREGMQLHIEHIQERQYAQPRENPGNALRLFFGSAEDGKQQEQCGNADGKSGGDISRRVHTQVHPRKGGKQAQNRSQNDQRGAAAVDSRGKQRSR